MRLLIALLFCGIVSAQRFTVVQINADWNERNKVELPKVIAGATVMYGHLEDQPIGLQKKIKAVPVILVYKDDQPIGQFVAGIDLKLNVSVKDIETLIKRNR